MVQQKITRLQSVGHPFLIQLCETLSGPKLPPSTPTQSIDHNFAMLRAAGAINLLHMVMVFSS